jgi:hypothetical protein
MAYFTMTDSINISVAVKQSKTKLSGFYSASELDRANVAAGEVSADF